MIRPEKIIILTSDNMTDNRAEAIDSYVNEYFKHYKVIKITEKEFAKKHLVNLRNKIYIYGVQKNSFIYKLYDKTRKIYSKVGNYVRQNSDYKKIKKSKGKFKKINNIYLRFNPKAIICFSNFSLYYAVKAKHKFGLECDLVMFPNSFTLDKNGMLLKADKYIVENKDFKNELVLKGIKEEDIFVKKFPIDSKNFENQSIEICKAQFELDERPAIMLTASKLGNYDIKEVFNLIIDLGTEFNFIVYCGENDVLYRKLNAIKDQLKADNIKLYSTLNNYECLFMAMDYVLSVYDLETIYNCFAMHKPMVLFAPKNLNEENDLEYLEKNGICLYAKTPTEVIVRMFDLLNNDNSKKLEKLKFRQVETGTPRTAELLIKLVTQKKEA